MPHEPPEQRGFKFVLQSPHKQPSLGIYAQQKSLPRKISDINIQSKNDESPELSTVDSTTALSDSQPLGKHRQKLLGVYSDNTCVKFQPWEPTAGK